MARARDDFWGCRRLALLCLVVKTSHMGVDVDELACHLCCPMNCGWQAWVQSLLTSILSSHRNVWGGATLVRLFGGGGAKPLGQEVWRGVDWLSEFLTDRNSYGKVRLYHNVVILCQSYHADYVYPCGRVVMSDGERPRGWSEGGEGQEPN
jgi:hypothetical protein